MSSGDGVRLAAVGDIMLGDLPACSGFGVGSTIRRNGPTFPFERARGVLADCDLLFGNLEVVISAFDRDRDPFEAVHFRAQPEAVDGLVAAGFHVLNLANNHIMQHGRSAVLETVELLGQHEIGFIGIEDQGTAIDNFLVRSTNGIRVGFLGYNFRPLQYFFDPPMYVEGTTERVETEIERHRSEVDWLVVSLHWGEEFVDRPSAEQVHQARRFVDAGADVILGHHPHVVQGVEQYRGRVIAYSLGDFIFDLWQPRLRETVILRVDLEDRRELRYEITPARINRHWQPEILDGPAARQARARLEGLSRLIDPRRSQADYLGLATTERNRFRREMWRQYATHLHRYRPRDLYANARRIIRARMPRAGRKRSRLGRGAT
jgi:gamma-polyglutamate biosynthesis protein CapA